MTQTLLSDWASKSPKVFVVGDKSPKGEGYMSAIDQIFAVTPPGEDLTISEISERVNDRFGHTPIGSLKNAIARACKRGEFIKKRGRANVYRRSSS